MVIIFVFLSIFIIQFVIALEMNFIGPLAPFLSNYFGIKGSQVILLNLGYSISGIFVPFIGYLSDIYGKKKFMIIGLLSFILGCFGCAYSLEAIYFSVSRILIGLSYFTLMSTMLSYLSDFIDYSNRAKANGVMRFSFSLAILLSPIYASYIVDKFGNLKYIYLPLAITAFIPIFILLFLPESSKNNLSILNTKNIIKVATTKNSKIILFSLFLIISIPTLLYNYLGLHLTTNFNFLQSEVGRFYSFIAVGTIIGVVTSAIFSAKIGNLKYSKVFFFVLLIALIPIGFTQNIYLLMISSFLFAIGLDGGFSAYQTYITEIEKDMRGTFVSLIYTVNALTITFYSLIGPKIYEAGGIKLIIILSLIFMIISILLMSNLNDIRQD